MYTRDPPARETLRPWPKDKFSPSILALDQNNRRQRPQANTETLDDFRDHRGPVASDARELYERDMKGEVQLGKNGKL
jgi:hypothetical protein